MYNYVDLRELESADSRRKQIVYTMFTLRYACNVYDILQDRHVKFEVLSGPNILNSVYYARIQI